MNQALYAHMNNKRKMKKKYVCGFLTELLVSPALAVGLETCADIPLAPGSRSLA
jgi:hypothetical protein